MAHIQNIGGFFSDYYLGQLRETQLKGQLGENTARRGFQRISRLWEKAATRTNGDSPKSQVMERWVTPLLFELGFEDDKFAKSFSIETSKEVLIGSI